MRPGKGLYRERKFVGHPDAAGGATRPPANENHIVKVAGRCSHSAGYNLLGQYLLTANVGYLAPGGHREPLWLVGVGKRGKPDHRRLECTPVHAQLRGAAGGFGGNFAQLHLARHSPAAVINHHMCKPLGLAANLYVSLYPHLHPKLGAFLVVHMTHVIHIVVAGLHSFAHVPFAGMIHPALLELGSRRPHGAYRNHCGHHGHPPHTHDTIVSHDANIRISSRVPPARLRRFDRPMCTDVPRRVVPSKSILRLISDTAGPEGIVAGPGPSPLLRQEPWTAYREQAAAWSVTRICLHILKTARSLGTGISKI